MKTFLISVLLFGLPSIGAAEVPTDAELEAEVQQLAMPRLEARLKAQATAYRMYEETARSIGLRIKTAARTNETQGVELAVVVPR